MNLCRLLLEPIYFMRTSKKILELQIEVFLEWGRRNGIVSTDYREWFLLFLLFTDRHDVMDITLEDIDFFIENEHTVNRTQYSQHSARKALRALQRFYMARSRNGKAKLKGGRPPHLDEISQVQKYRKMVDEKGKPLSFRAITKIMGKPIALVHRWSKYPLKKNED